VASSFPDRHRRGLVGIAVSTNSGCEVAQVATQRAEPSSDFHFVERDEPDKIAATLVKLVQERIPERFRLDPIRDVQVLCPMNRG